MSKREKAEYKDRHALRNAGWDVSQTDKIAFNGGEESPEHLFLKAGAAYHLKQTLDYRVDSEVSMPAGDVDVLAYGHPDRNPIVVEVETNATEEVVEDKLQRYIRGEPPRDMFVLDPTQLESNVREPLEHAKQNL